MSLPILQKQSLLGCIQGRDSVRQHFVCTVIVLEAFMPTWQKRIRAKEKEYLPHMANGYRGIHSISSRNVTE